MHMKVEAHFLVVEGSSVQRATAQGVQNESYRVMMLMGSTMDEAGLRNWVVRTWGAKATYFGAIQDKTLTEESPLADIIKASGKGGWVVYQTPGMDTVLSES